MSYKTAQNYNVNVPTLFYEMAREAVEMVDESTHTYNAYCNNEYCQHDVMVEYHEIENLPELICEVAIKMYKRFLLEPLKMEAL